MLDYLDRNCHSNIDILKIDIDSYDGPVLKSILNGGYRPSIIVAEIQPEIPPPISFSVLYDERYKTLDDDGHIGGFYGMSLSYAVNLCSSFGYQLVELDFETKFTHDAIFVHGNIFSNPNFNGKTTREIWLDTIPGYHHFYEYAVDSSIWRNMKDIDEAGRYIFDMIMYANTRKHKGIAIPFCYDY